MEVYYLVLNYNTALTLGMNPITRFESKEEMLEETEFLAALGMIEYEHYRMFTFNYDQQSVEEDAMHRRQDWDLMIRMSKMLKSVIRKEPTVTV